MNILSFLAAVAFAAGGHDVVDVARTASADWNNMVPCCCRLTTVCTLAVKEGQQPLLYVNRNYGCVALAAVGMLSAFCAMPLIGNISFTGYLGGVGSAKSLPHFGGR